MSSLIMPYRTRLLEAAYTNNTILNIILNDSAKYRDEEWLMAVYGTLTPPEISIKSKVMRWPARESRHPDIIFGWHYGIELPAGTDLSAYIGPAQEARYLKDKLIDSTVNVRDYCGGYYWPTDGGFIFLAIDRYSIDKPGDKAWVIDDTKPAANDQLVTIVPSDIPKDPRLFYIGKYSKKVLYPDPMEEYDQAWALYLANILETKGFSVSSLPIELSILYQHIVGTFSSKVSQGLSNLVSDSLQEWTLIGTAGTLNSRGSFTFKEGVFTHEGVYKVIIKSINFTAKDVVPPELPYDFTVVFEGSYGFTYLNLLSNPLVANIVTAGDITTFSLPTVSSSQYSIKTNSDGTWIQLSGEFDLKAILKSYKYTKDPTVTPSHLTLNADYVESFNIPKFSKDTTPPDADEDVKPSNIDVDLRIPNKPLSNQYALGTCVANAITSGCELLLARGGTSIFELSRLYVYYYSRAASGLLGGVDGSVVSTTLPVCVTQGIPLEVTWPYHISKVDVEPPSEVTEDAYTHRLTGYTQLVTANAIKLALSKGLPVVFSYNVTESFENLHNLGNLSQVSPDTSIWRGAGSTPHAMLIVGYSESNHSFIVENSWGYSWGCNGYIWLPYTEVTSSLMLEIYSLDGMINTATLNAPPNSTPASFTVVKGDTYEIQQPPTDPSELSLYFSNVENYLKPLADNVSWDIIKAIPANFDTASYIEVTSRTSYTPTSDAVAVAESLPTFYNRLRFETWAASPNNYQYESPQYQFTPITFIGRDAYQAPVMKLESAPKGSHIISVKAWTSHATLMELMRPYITFAEVPPWDCLRVQYDNGTIALYPYENKDEELCLIEAVQESVNKNSTTWQFGAKFFKDGVRVDGSALQQSTNRREGGRLLPFWTGLTEDAFLKEVAEHTSLIPSQLHAKWSGTFQYITSGCAEGEMKGNTTDADTDLPLYYSINLVDFPDNRKYYYHTIKGSCDLSSFTTSLRIYFAASVSVDYGGGSKSVTMTLSTYPNDVFLKAIEIIPDSNGGNAYAKVQTMGTGLVYKASKGSSPSEGGFVVHLQGTMADVMHPNRALRFIFADTAGITFIHETTDPILEVGLGQFIQSAVIKSSSTVMAVNPFVCSVRYG